MKSYPTVHRIPGKSKHNTPFRHHIATFETAERIFFLHATKGWRSETKRRQA